MQWDSKAVLTPPANGAKMNPIQPPTNNAREPSRRLLADTVGVRPVYYSLVADEDDSGVVYQLSEIAAEVLAEYHQKAKC